MKQMMVVILLGLMCGYISMGGFAQTEGTSSLGTVLKKKGETIVMLMTEKKYAEVNAYFDPSLKEALPVEKLQKIWEYLTKTMGAYKGYDAVRYITEAGYPVVYITYSFENALLDNKIVFNTQHQVIGFFFLPSQPVPPPPPEKELWDAVENAEKKKS